MLLGEVHPAVVTDADFDAVDGLRLDLALIEAAGFVEHEKVEVSDLTSGSRLSCQLRAGKSGEATVCGATAQVIKPGARITIASYGWLKGKAASKHEPSLVRVNDENRAEPPADAPRERGREK
jgi:aspartate 1-decarboxylase